MMRKLYAASVAGALLALAACDGTSSRLAPADEAPDAGNGGGNGGGVQQPVLLRNLVVDNINNNTSPTAQPININDLNIEIDTTPVNLDLVTG
ncbi:hypothetical protein [Algiphilus sp.]|uniref:hypothetical protein n=1 Tax=Algiphilus sp. TaxID=1872431 RepID=UPI003B5202BF